MVDVVGEIVRQQHVVLQCMIDVFSSRVALNCSKVLDGISMEWIHTVLEYLFRSSSFVQIIHPCSNSPILRRLTV